MQYLVELFIKPYSIIQNEDMEKVMSQMSNMISDKKISSMKPEAVVEL